jgi:hypothetical protein
MQIIPPRRKELWILRCLRRDRVVQHLPLLMQLIPEWPGLAPTRASSDDGAASVNGLYEDSPPRELSAFWVPPNSPPTACEFSWRRGQMGRQGSSSMSIGGEGDHQIKRRAFLATLSAVAALGVAPSHSTGLTTNSAS